MTRDDLVRFATRDWAAIADDKARYWAERTRSMAPADRLRLGDDLRQHAFAVRPGGPSESDRAADRATHLFVTEALRAVVRLGSR